MRRRPVPPAVLFLVLAVVVVAGVPFAAGSSMTTRPTIRLLDTSVPTLRGTGFMQREHVRLEIHDGHGWVVLAAAGLGGTFTKRVPGANPGNCTGFSVIAAGDRGSRATLKRPPGVCPPPP